MARTPLPEKLLLDEFLSAVKRLPSLPSIALHRMIKLLRKRLRMSQHTLAKRAGMPTSTIARIESGKTKPSLPTVQKIFKALHCDYAVIPLPREDLDLIVEKQIHQIAEKRVRYLKGTMALELQQPREAALRALVAREEKELTELDSDIWNLGN